MSAAADGEGSDGAGAEAEAGPLSDPHGELGVPRNASEQEIKSAWRRLAARWHPDRNSDSRAGERMKRINRAYRQLVGGDAAPGAASAAGPAAGSGPATDTAAEAAAADAESPESSDSSEAPEPPPRQRPPWWERNWGGARWEADGVARPRTVGLDIELDLERAAAGCVHRVEGSVADLCSACAGTGRLVSHQTDCTTCGGEGRVRPATDARWTVCPDCGGDGAARKPCDACKGSGEAQQPRRYLFDVRIPSGTRAGRTVVLRGQGQRGPASRGDLALRVQLRPHPYFSFDDEGKLVCRLPVDAYAVAGAGSAEVPLPGGGTAPIDLARGPVQVLNGMGWPERDGSRGLLVVETRAVTPPVSTEPQRELLRRLADELRAGGYAGCDELAAWQAWLRGRPEAGAGAGAGTGASAGTGTSAGASADAGGKASTSGTADGAARAASGRAGS